MPQKLNRDIIFLESRRMIDEKGYQKFSIRELASRLDVKPASLYNHIDGIEDIYRDLVETSSKRLSGKLTNAMKGKEPDEAFISGARAYRKFAEQNRNLYEVLISARSSKDEATVKAGFNGFRPLFELIKSYGGDKRQTLHFIRAFRSVIHGFVEITHNGFMQRGPASKDETYEIIIAEYLKALKGLKKDEKI